MFKKETLLFITLGGFFIANAIIAEFIGVKLFSVESTLGLEPVHLSFFGYGDLSFVMTAGVLLWPVVFVMTDVINEYYGKRGVRILSWLAAALISYAFVMVWIAMQTHPADFWIEKDLGNGETVNMHRAFNSVFGQGLRIIIGSLVAFLIGQLLDAHVFYLMKKSMGSGKLWIRATVSTLISQLVDSFVVLVIAFYPDPFPLGQVLAIGTVNYIYKVIIAILFIPVLYGIHALIRIYMGRERAEALIESATHQDTGK